jgi:hypothetical protein
VDTLRRNDDASVTTLLSGKKVRGRVRSACFTYWHSVKHPKFLRCTLIFLKQMYHLFERCTSAVRDATSPSEDMASFKGDEGASPKFWICDTAGNTRGKKRILDPWILMDPRGSSWILVDPGGS